MAVALTIADRQKKIPFRVCRIGSDLACCGIGLNQSIALAKAGVEVYHAGMIGEDEKGAKCVIVLPKGTNEKLDFEPDNEGENKILRDVNKWLIECETVSLD